MQRTPAPGGAAQPTHVLYQARAHAIGEEPLVVGAEIPAGTRGFNLAGALQGVSRRHCSIYRNGQGVVVEDHSSYGTFVNGMRVDGRTTLAAGDRLRKRVGLRQVAKVVRRLRQREHGGRERARRDDGPARRLEREVEIERIDHVDPGARLPRLADALVQQRHLVARVAADEHDHVGTLSELAAKCSGQATVLAGPPECPQRPKCQAGLIEVYDFKAGSFSSLDAGGPQTKNALKTGSASVGLVFSSDAALAAS